MSGRRVLVLVVVAVLAAGFLCYAIMRKRQFERAAPAWLDPQQPPEGVISQLPTLTGDQSWAANRCRPLVAPCAGYTAGSRVRRTYPPSLAHCEGSVVQFGASLGVG